MSKEQWFTPVLLKKEMSKKYPFILQFSDSEISMFTKVINCVVADAGLETGVDILSHAFEDVDLENLQVWLKTVSDGLSAPGAVENDVIPNAIGFLFSQKKKYQQ